MLLGVECVNQQDAEVNIFLSVKNSSDTTMEKETEVATEKVSEKTEQTSVEKTEEKSTEKTAEKSTEKTEEKSNKQLFAEKQAERMKRLRELHSKRNEARQQNHKEVVEEDKRLKLPTNWESRKRQAEWLLQDEAARKEAQDKGEDYERQKLLHIDATEAERIGRKKRNKKNPDPGFSDYEQAAIRQYNRLVKNIKPNMDSYEDAKDKLGPAFYGDRNTILHGLHEDKKEAVDKMVSDLEKQIAKRDKYSRRRMHNDDADIDYINERNAKFNQKLERFYGEYTRETKLNLERGTAI